MITINMETSEAIFSRSDGKEARFPLSLRTDETSELAKIHFTPSRTGLLAVSKSGDEVLFEMPRYDGADQLEGRVTVYLDQNHWSTIANVLHSPQQVNGPEQSAALRLARLVANRQIILPASAAHHHETTKRFSRDKRYRLGLAVLQLSRGWQMRDPLQVRRNEFRQAITSRSGLPSTLTPEPVFSLAPDTLYSPHRRPSSYKPPQDFPPEEAFYLRAMLGATVSIDVLLDAERIEEGPDIGWTAASQRFSDWLDGSGRDRQQKRKSIDAYLLHDLSREIAEESAASGISVDQMQDWVLHHWSDDIVQSPSAGVFRELVHDRHLNIGTTWRRNDLTDMVYLSCAAGYADFVVCERHMCGNLIQGINRLGRSTQVFRQLSDAIGPIERVVTARSAPVARSETGS
jgi:hypothetical protein